MTNLSETTLCESDAKYIKNFCDQRCKKMSKRGTATVSTCNHCKYRSLTSKNPDGTTCCMFGNIPQCWNI